MRHKVVFSVLSGFLIAAAGGVFILVNEEPDLAVPSEALQESSLAAAVEVATEEVIEEEEIIEIPQSAPQSAPMVVAEPTPQPTSNPEPVPPPEPAPLPPPPPPPTPTIPPESVPEPESPEGPININTADYELLQYITGVGQAVAQRIIDYRNSVSLFYQIEDIKNVSGIGDATFEKMKDEITVGNISPPPPPAPAPTPNPPSPAPTPPPPPPPPPEPSPVPPPPPQQ